MPGVGKRRTIRQHRTVVRRIRPTAAQEELLKRQAGTCRKVRNIVVATHRRDYAETGRCNWRYMAKRNDRGQPGSSELFREIREAPESKWMGRFSYTICREVVREMDPTYQAFFDWINGGCKGRKRGLPKFKSKRDCRESFPLPAGAFRISPDGTALRIQRLGWFSLGKRSILERYADANPEVRNGQVKQRAGKWYLHLVVVVDVPAREGERMAGIDRNVGQVAFTDGVRHMIETMPDTSRDEACARRHQSAASRRYRKDAGIQSKGYWRARNRAERASYRIACKRKNWLHQLTAMLSRFADIIVLEDLNIPAMTVRSGRRKRRLNRGILSTGWGAVERLLLYKAAGVLKIDPAYTSWRCSACSHTEQANRPSQAVFRCRICDFEINADINAALNILAAGRRLFSSDREGCSCLMLADTLTPDKHPSRKPAGL